jgi:hypothetical protein
MSSSTTLTMGFTITLDEDASKGTVVAMCEDMASMLGEGNALRPLGGRKGLLSWHRWPGWVDGVGTRMSGKEMRLLVHGGSLPRTGGSCFLLGFFCLRLLQGRFKGLRTGWSCFFFPEMVLRRDDRVARGRARGPGDGGVAGRRERGAAQGAVPDAAGVVWRGPAVAPGGAGGDPGGDAGGRVARDGPELPARAAGRVAAGRGQARGSAVLPAGVSVLVYKKKLGLLL